MLVRKFQKSNLICTLKEIDSSNKGKMSLMWREALEGAEETFEVEIICFNVV